MNIKTNDKIRKIAGVRFRENWKVYDFEAVDVEISVGDKVIVDSDRGLGLAQVVRLKKLEANSGEQDVPIPQPEISPIPSNEEASPAPAEENSVFAEAILPADAATEARREGKNGGNGAPEKNCTPKSLRKIIRKAGEEDLARERKNRERETEAFGISQDLIAERELPMKLIRVEYSLDASRATFFFFSETRIDFRDLVKDLAFKLRSRIEMRQIGVRDVARMIGGFGPCGRELCCASFLKNFEPVSIRMAKKQEMVLNPAKISGVCGRLLCCLSYEFEMYDDIKKDMVAMRDAALLRDKKENEERRIAVEHDEEERRQAVERKRQDERKSSPERREKKREETPRVQKGERRREGDQEKRGEPEKKKAHPQEKNHPQSKERQPQQKADNQEARPPKVQQQKQHPNRPQQQNKAPQQQPEGQPPEQQTGAEQAAEGDKSAKKNKRRFWRRKKKGPSGERPPLGSGGGQGAGSEGARV